MRSYVRTTLVALAVVLVALVSIARQANATPARPARPVPAGYACTLQSTNWLDTSVPVMWFHSTDNCTEYQDQVTQIQNWNYLSYCYSNSQGVCNGSWFKLGGTGGQYCNEWDSAYMYCSPQGYCCDDWPWYGITHGRWYRSEVTACTTSVRFPNQYCVGPAVGSAYYY